MSPRTLDRAWAKARRSIGRDDVRYHDLRHSGLTWAAATGATLADLMRQAGHASPAAAIRYQHATSDRDRAVADTLATLAARAQPTADGTTGGSAGAMSVGAISRRDSRGLFADFAGPDAPFADVVGR